MRNVLAFLYKEWRIQFGSATAYVVLAGFTILAGFFFFDQFSVFTQYSAQARMYQNTQMLQQFNLNDWVFTPLIANINILLLLVVPLITMGSFAQERRLGTDELILTSPIKIWHMIAGKFFSSMAFFALLLLLTFQFLFVLKLYGDLDYGKIAAGYLGLFFMGGAFISLGLFASSLTKSQIVAGVGTFSALLIFWIVGWLAESIPGKTGDVLAYLSLTNHFRNFSEGAIQIKDIVFYITFIFFFFFMTTRSMESTRWRHGIIKPKTFSMILLYEGLALLLFSILTFVFANEAYLFGLIFLIAGLILILVFVFTSDFSIKELLKSSRSKFGAGTVYYSLIVLGLLVAVNVIGVFRNHEWDVTEIKSRSLSEQTLGVLGNLEKKITILAFYKSSEEKIVEDILQRYERAGDFIEYEFVDPYNPVMVEKYDVREAGKIVVLCGERKANVLAPTEQDITTGIIKVSKPAQGAIYFLEGHDEASLESDGERGLLAAKFFLEKANYTVRRLLLESMEKVPADCRALIIPGPVNKIPETVLISIENYLEKGGRALFMIDPKTDSGLENIAKKYGVKMEKTIVLDPTLRLYENDPLGLIPISQEFSNHPITDKQKQSVVFPMIQSLEIEQSAAPGVKIEPICKSSPYSWAETDLETLLNQGKAIQDEKDLKGPKILAVAASKYIEVDQPQNDDLNPADSKKQTRVVIVGDSDFATNAFFQYLFNGPIFLNMVHWLSGEEYLMAIPPKSYKPANVHLSGKERQVLFIASVFLIPQIIIMFGIGAIIRRQGR